jgi:hypothetical protein
LKPLMMATWKNICHEGNKEYEVLSFLYYYFCCNYVIQNLCKFFKKFHSFFSHMFLRDGSLHICAASRRGSLRASSSSSTIAPLQADVDAVEEVDGGEGDGHECVMGRMHVVGVLKSDFSNTF